MAENINISFAPNKNADEAQRIADIENYLQTLTERTKFALSTIIENYNETDDNKTSQLKQNIALQSVSDSVGKFTNTDKNCEIFNDYANNVAQAYYSHAEGYSTVASAPYTHAEGYMTQATAPNAHAEGSGTKASDNSHSEGLNTQANSYASHAEGENTVASGRCSHAEGQNTVADGMYTHAEGSGSKAIASYSHAGGMNSEAKGMYSFTHGSGTKTSYYCGTVFGKNNKNQSALFVIGNGDAYEGGESDALTLDGNGNLWIEGSFEASAQHGGLGISVHGAARFGENWTSDSVYTLLAVGNGYDSERTRDALTLDKNGNLYISGKLTADGGIDIPIAAAESVGGIKVGENLSISEDGTLSANAGEYTLPAATVDTLGGVKIGDNITVADDGTISVDLSRYLQSSDIADWAKQPNKPVYTADEVGAAAEQHKHSTADITDFPAVPTKVSELQNDSGYLSEETDPTVPAWAKSETKPTYTAAEVGAAESVHTHEQSDITGLESALASKANTSHTHTKSEITDFPTLGTAAGKNAADFYPAKAANVLGGDYNELKTNGIFEMQGNAANPTANTPNGNHTNNNFYIQVFVRGATYLTQIATSARSDKTQYIRSQTNGVWNNWEKIKSGDADTLDGKHASDIAADITTAVNAVEIGGRNLLYYSRFDKKYPNAWAYSETVSYTFDGNAATLTKAETTSRHFTTQASVSNGVVVANPNLVPENGCTYTISCEVMKAEGYDVGNGTKITNRYNFTDGTVKDFDVDVLEASETAWTKYSRTYTYASDKTVRYTQFIVALGAQACGIKIRNVKFEKGNKATDWSPAPEDGERRIASLEARVAALEAAALAGGE